MQTVDWLMENGADVSLRMLNDQNLTPLTLAVRQRDVDTFQYLSSKLQTKAWAYGNVCMTIQSLEQVRSLSAQTSFVAEGRGLHTTQATDASNTSRARALCAMHDTALPLRRREHSDTAPRCRARGGLACRNDWHRALRHGASRTSHRHSVHVSGGLIRPGASVSRVHAAAWQVDTFLKKNPHHQKRRFVTSDSPGGTFAPAAVHSSKGELRFFVRSLSCSIRPPEPIWQQLLRCLRCWSRSVPLLSPGPPTYRPPLAPPRPPLPPPLSVHSPFPARTIPCHGSLAVPQM
jgi:hypothetical protein